MRILELSPKAIHRVRYLNAAKRGGVESACLDVLTARVDALPQAVRGLLATSDLQGVVTPYNLGGQSCLLGEHLPSELEHLADTRRLPPPACLGALLAGDLYSVPAGDKRGATGDVRSVWYAFAEAFAWVAGVAGNHDLFGSDKEQRRLASEPNVHLLDSDSVTLGQVKVAGVGYIIGDPNKPGRRARDDFMASLELVLEECPEILVLHEGPSGDRRQPGTPEIRELLLAAPPMLVVCGHCHWDVPLCELDNGTQVLNVDARAVLLRAE